jgi:hypothetical protein
MALANNDSFISKSLKTCLKEIKLIESQLEINSNTSPLREAIDEAQNYFDQINCVSNSKISIQYEIKQATLYKIHNLANTKMEIIRNSLSVFYGEK